MTHNCQQKCTNIYGTFECSCVEGYILDGYDNGVCYGQCHIIVTTICSFLL